MGWALQKEGCLRIHGGRRPHRWSLPGKLAKASHYIRCLSCCSPCL